MALTTKQYAEVHGVSTDTVRRWIEDFLIYAEKIGGRFYIPEDEPPPAFDNEFEEPEGSEEGEFGTFDDPEEPEDEPLAEDEFEGDEDLEGELVESEPFDEPCLDHETFPHEDLRTRTFVTSEDAEDYASDIPVPTRVFKRCADGRFQVVVEY